MSKVIAVLGAGTGLGVSVARRFGREGFRVALVARRKDRLDTLVEVLAGEGIEAVAFSADLSKPAEVPALVEAIRDRFGRIDVVAYGPISGDQGFTPAAKLDAATLQGLSPLLLFTPVEVVRAVLPEWTERGEGAFLLAQGYSAAQPMPHLSGLGPVMSATRNYLYSLNAELADTGIYVGALTIASLIARSEVSAAAQAAFESADGPHFPVVDPDDLAEHYWNMYTKRDRVEQFHPESLTPQATA
ncbi:MULTISPECIES: SDR family NAD(P)-dependent oxidoreductase [Streptomyces violaceusniger group]|uniref:SDR family NAD(P)-dependent oxidoreductase n=2 Tax=Streptomyces javensis TaxID=114698 RepID=A0ABS0R5F0_9ACTN|nr:SDR family NAD(P)-dependent oxidoreductase [Streptomyces javensis]MBI0312604.1 SDR family NAD(P)-dependent oxidoreductase [Streptomyces javensis]